MSGFAVMLWPPQLFIPDRTRCFQQPQIFPPWRQWKEAGARSIALLWQHIPLPWGPRCLGDIGRAMPVDQMDSEQLPLGKQDSAGRGGTEPRGHGLAHGGACTPSRGCPRRGAWSLVPSAEWGLRPKGASIATQCVKIRRMAGKPCQWEGFCWREQMLGPPSLVQDLQP